MPSHGWEQASYTAVPPPEVKAFPELLRAAGYYTFVTSKLDYQRSTARRTDTRGGEGIRVADVLGGEGVEMRRDCDGIAERADPRTQVFGDQEQQVRARSVRSGRLECGGCETRERGRQGDAAPQPPSSTLLELRHAAIASTPRFRKARSSLHDGGVDSLQGTTRRSRPSRSQAPSRARESGPGADRLDCH
jgi:arylsulfatase A-like enzyme